MDACSDTFLDKIDQMIDKDGEVPFTFSDDNEPGDFLLSSR